MLSLIASQPYIVFVQDSSYSKLHTALVNKLLRKWYGAYAVVLHTILYRGGELHEGPVFGRILRQTDRQTDRLCLITLKIQFGILSKVTNIKRIN